MIDLYFAPTPNGHKITLFLEEAGAGLSLDKGRLGKGGQFRRNFCSFRLTTKFRQLLIILQPMAANR